MLCRYNTAITVQFNCNQKCKAMSSIDWDNDEEKVINVFIRKSAKKKSVIIKTSKPFAKKIRWTMIRTMAFITICFTTPSTPKNRLRRFSSAGHWIRHENWRKWKTQTKRRYRWSILMGHYGTRKYIWYILESMYKKAVTWNTQAHCILHGFPGNNLQMM